MHNIFVPLNINVIKSRKFLNLSLSSNFELEINSNYIDRNVATYLEKSHHMSKNLLSVGVFSNITLSFISNKLPHSA